jgi:hypothetical protein
MAGRATPWLDGAWRHGGALVGDKQRGDNEDDRPKAAPRKEDGTALLTGETKTLCSAWHRRKGTAPLGSGYGAAVRQSSRTMLRRTMVGGGEQPWQSGEWPLG